MLHLYVNKGTDTWAAPSSGNRDNAGRQRVSVRVWSREAGRVGAGVQGHTVTLGAQYSYQGQVVMSPLTFELPVDHHLLRDDGLHRHADPHQQPGRVGDSSGEEKYIRAYTYYGSVSLD